MYFLSFNCLQQLILKVYFRYITAQHPILHFDSHEYSQGNFQSSLADKNIHIYIVYRCSCRWKLSTSDSPPARPPVTLLAQKTLDEVQANKLYSAFNDAGKKTLFIHLPWPCRSRNSKKEAELPSSRFTFVLRSGTTFLWQNVELWNIQCEESTANVAPLIPFILLSENYNFRTAPFRNNK